MAYYSLKCVECRETTKRCAGKYTARDEKGRRFWGDMYTCDNSTCRVNLERMRGEKQVHMLREERQQPYN